MTKKRRPSILLVTRNLPPLVGGMERLNWHMAEQLSRWADVRIVGPEGAAAMAPAGVPVREAPLKPLWKFLWHARVLARREARAFKPDLVLAGSGLTAPLVRSAARACGAHTAVYAHGLDVAVRHPVYRALWLPALRRMDRVIANSRATAELCRAAGIDPARIGIVHPGVDLPVAAERDAPRGSAPGAERRPFLVSRDDLRRSAPARDTCFGSPAGRLLREAGESGDARPEAPGPERGPFPVSRDGDREMLSPEACRNVHFASNIVVWGNACHGSPDNGFRERHNLAGRPILLSVGRLSARKGLREFVTHALPQIVAANPDVVLVIVGDAPVHALHAEAQTPENIRSAAASVGVADHLRFLGKIADGELDAVYRAADVHVFPVRDFPGDPEGFGMVAVEAAAHGLPTVAFACGGVPDAVVEGESGSLVPPGDYAAFATDVNAWIRRSDRGEVARRCIAAAEAFSWDHFGERLRQLLGAVVT